MALPSNLQVTAKILGMNLGSSRYLNKHTKNFSVYKCPCVENK